MNFRLIYTPSGLRKGKKNWTLSTLVRIFEKKNKKKNIEILYASSEICKHIYCIKKLESNRGGRILVVQSLR